MDFKKEKCKNFNKAVKLTIKVVKNMCDNGAFKNYLDIKDINGPSTAFQVLKSIDKSSPINFFIRNILAHSHMLDNNDIPNFIVACSYVSTNINSKKLIIAFDKLDDKNKLEIKNILTNICALALDYQECYIK